MGQPQHAGGGLGHGGGRAVARDDLCGADQHLRGAELRIAESELQALPEGSYYYHQLTGLRVDDEQGAAIGVVDSVMETGAETRVLVVRGPQGETLLPFAAAFVKSVDLARGLIVAVRPEYAGAD